MSCQFRIILKQKYIVLVWLVETGNWFKSCWNKSNNIFSVDYYWSYTASDVFNASCAFISNVSFMQFFGLWACGWLIDSHGSS